MITYKIVKDPRGDCILRSDGYFIPFDPANTDYQEFVQWCEQGNVPEPADEEV